MSSNYCDDHGWPGTVNDGVFDGGDTASITGTIYTLDDVMWSVEMPHPHELFYNNLPVRHPDSTKWWGQPNRFSRDQLIPIICCGITGWNVDKFYHAHRRHLFLFAWNTRKNGVMDAPKKLPDICGPSVWALWLRYNRDTFQFPLLLNLLDVELLLSAIHWRFWRRDRVSRNIMLQLITCRRVLPTYISRLAFAITDFNDLIARWDGHCRTVNEFPTAHLFAKAIVEVANDKK